MNFAKVTSPYLRKKTSVERMMIDVLIALAPIVIFAVWHFGFRTLLVLLVSSVVMIISEIIYWRLRDKEKKLTINNYLAPLISAVIYSFLLPVDLNLIFVGLGALAGILFGKLFFGGLGSNIFNPAAVGRIFVGISFGASFTYRHLVSGGTPLELIGLSEGLLAYALNAYPLLDLFFGNVPGAIGETSTILILAGGIYLFIRRSADYRTTLSMVFSFAILVLITGLIFNHQEALSLLLFHLLSGGLIFGAIFMVTDPVTTPVTKRGRILFGILVGSLTFLIRFYGGFAEGVAFAILFANMLVPLIDYPKLSYPKMTKRYFWFLSGLSLFFILIAVAAVFNL